LKPIMEWNIKANNNKWYNFKYCHHVDKIAVVQEFKNKFPDLQPIFLEEVPLERTNK